MRTLRLFLLVFWAAHPASEPSHFRYRRALTAPSLAAGSEACATLDAAVYAHALPSLKDLRLLREGAMDDADVPYAVTLSETAEAESEPATVRNLGRRGDEVVFDLVMPNRKYTDVQLDLDAHNFIASAKVTAGSGPSPVVLGTYTLFDLAAQHLGRSTTLPLQESTFPVLHVALRSTAPSGASTDTPPLSPAVVRGAAVPPSRDAQAIYTVAAETSTFTQQGTVTVALLSLPAHVPVERVSIDLAPEFTGNFSRDVVVVARGLQDGSGAEGERVTGAVERVRLAPRPSRAAPEVRVESLGFPATLGANLQSDATVEVRIENGDDAPLPLRAVRLEMRQRRLCFPLPASGSRQFALLYGDATLEAAHYDFTRLFSPSGQTVQAVLAPESLNPAYIVQPLPRRSLSERHPELLWVVLLAAVCVLAVVAIHSAKRMQR